MSYFLNIGAGGYGLSPLAHIVIDNPGYTALAALFLYAVLLAGQVYRTIKGDWHQ